MFEIGDRVILSRNDGGKERGKVTRILPRLRKIVTDSGRRVEVSVRRLKLSPDKATLFFS